MNFPFVQDENNLLARARSIGLRSAAFEELISTIRPFPEGNALLWAIHKLDIQDKHKSIPTVTVQSMTMIAPAAAIAAGYSATMNRMHKNYFGTTEPVASVREVNGIFLVDMITNEGTVTREIESIERHPIVVRHRENFRFPVGIRPERCLSSSPLSIDLRFGADAAALVDEPVLDSLHRCSQVVSEILKLFFRQFGVGLSD